MLKNISSMNKKNNNELLEIPDFLKKLKSDEQKDIRPKAQEVHHVESEIISKVEEDKPTKAKPKVDIQAKIKEHTQNYFIDIK